MKLLSDESVEHIVLFVISIVLLMGSGWMVHVEFGPIAMILAGLLVMACAGVYLSLQRLSRDLRGGGPDTAET